MIITQYTNCDQLRLPGTARHSSFYKDIVCQCENIGPHDTIERIGTRSLARCAQCGKFAQWALRQCPRCKAIFYWYFSHPKQRSPKPHCWRCLESGRINKAESPYELHESETIPPPDYLVPPPVEPKTGKQISDELDALMREMGIE